MVILARILSIFYIANGVVMIAAPEWWYGATPGVSGTGPFNSHFVIDVGIAFGVSGALIAWGAGGAGWRLVLAGAGFPVGHAIFHIAGLLVGDGHGPLWVETFGVILPAIVSLWVVMAMKSKEA